MTKIYFYNYEFLALPRSTKIFEELFYLGAKGNPPQWALGITHSKYGPGKKHNLSYRFEPPLSPLYCVGTAQKFNNLAHSNFVN